MQTEDEVTLYDIRQPSLSSMTACGTALRTMGAGAASMEEVASRITHYLHDNVRDRETGQRALVLVRLFKTHAYGDLDPSLQAAARMIPIGGKLTAATKCLTLLATVGTEERWNRRTTSRAHQAIPLASEDLVRQLPMISALTGQFGLELSDVIEPDSQCIQDMQERSFNLFLVPEVVGDPRVPAQEEFVIPHRIRSVLGFGGMLPSGNLFAVVMFSKVPITHEAAQLFKPLALAARLALMPFDRGAVFNNADAGVPAQGR